MFILEISLWLKEERIGLSGEDVLPWDLLQKNWPRNDEGRGQGVGWKGVGLREI